EQVDGNPAFVVRLPQEAAPGVPFDHGYGFDAIPRLRRADMGSGMFQIEAGVRLLDVAGKGEAGAGLVIELDRADRSDLLLYGLAGAEGSVRFERTADLSPRSAPLDLGTPQASLRVQRDGGVYRFFARRGSGTPWILQHELALPAPPPRAVGLYVRNRGDDSPAVVAAFDDFALGPLPSAPPTLSICSDGDHAWVGEEYRREIIVTTAVPGMPYELAVVEGPRGLRVSAGGSISGWTPGPLDPGDDEHVEEVEIEASSKAGSSTLRWKVAVAERSAPIGPFGAEDPLASGIWTAQGGGDTWSLQPLGEETGLRMTLGGGGKPADGLSTLLLTRRDMGPGDFVIETQVSWPWPASGDAGAGLVIAFGETDRLLWGPWKGKQLAAVRGQAEEIVLPFEPGGRTDLRIRKDCGRFSLDYRLPGDRWSRAGGTDIWKPVESVGIFLACGGGTNGARAVEFSWFDMPGHEWEGLFRRGDIDGDRAVTIGDAILALMILFQMGETFGCPDAVDVDDNGSITIGDAISILFYLFGDGPAPVSPGPNICGPDPTPDGWPPESCVAPCP
ncbi:MAG: hypothetical protein JXP34_22120, partial [Planctomycetes bacterium]|nr:hypothetical protein [Planctomycetota bacterium]